MKKQITARRKKAAYKYRVSLLEWSLQRGKVQRRERVPDWYPSFDGTSQLARAAKE